jgi:hypothetical protein
MAIVSFKLDQLFMLLTPELVVVVLVGAVTFPSETDFIQHSLLIRSNFAVGVSCPLVHNPLPYRLVFIAVTGASTSWHHAMAIVSFKLDQLFILLVPEHYSPVVFAQQIFPVERPK